MKAELLRLMKPVLAKNVPTRVAAQAEAVLIADKVLFPENEKGDRSQGGFPFLLG
jgi:hypothetical protein